MWVQNWISRKWTMQWSMGFTNADWGRNRRFSARICSGDCYFCGELPRQDRGSCSFTGAVLQRAFGSFSWKLSRDSLFTASTLIHKLLVNVVNNALLKLARMVSFPTLPFGQSCFVVKERSRDKSWEDTRMASGLLIPHITWQQTTCLYFFLGCVLNIILDCIHH